MDIALQVQRDGRNHVNGLIAINSNKRLETLFDHFLISILFFLSLHIDEAVRRLVDRPAEPGDETRPVTFASTCRLQKRVQTK